ncbi:MAG: histidine--tRNA ligase [Clostridia bacterium]|nr:histidine--tRNA ligase [Clostridia bacterium]
MITTSPKGTEDLLPQDSYKWQYLERAFKETADIYNYKEVRVPTFEHTELFERGVGGTTDVVEKQMYTFNDKGGRSVTLRPEGTASVARSFIQNSLYALPMPMKMFYNIACFRYENKQKGRLREFHQFGVEAFGAKNPTMDAEVLSLALTFLDKVGLKDLSVNINSIGCPTCRKAYSDALKEYFRPHYDDLCGDCKGRFERNPLRIIDCKVPSCHELVGDAPTILDYLCDECRGHFESFKACLDGMGINYTVDPGIVRGLDYYTKTVFEIISGGFTVCGGGRYDGLVEEIGGKACPAVGFGLGIERLLLRLEETGTVIPPAPPVKLYIAPLGEHAVTAAQGLVYRLRKEGVSVDTDHFGRGLRASMKYADKLGAEYTMVLGDNELDDAAANMKNMATGEETMIKFDEIAKYLGGQN